MKPEGRTPQFIAQDQRLIVLSQAIRERRRQSRLAYTFDPGLALAERLTAQEDQPWPH